MPRKIKTVTETTEDVSQSDLDETETETASPEEIEEEATQSAIDQIVRNMDGTGGTVGIYRKGPRGLAFDYTERMSLEDFTANGLEEIKRRYGGGTYRLRFADQAGKYRGQATCSVDPRLKGELDQPAVGGGGDSRAMEALTAEVSKKNGDFANIMLQMMQMQQTQQQQTLQILTAAMAQPKTSSMKDVAGILAPFIPLAVKLIEGRATDSSLKAIETIAKVKDLFGGDGGGDSGGTIEKLLASLAPTIVARLQAGQAAPAPAAEQPQNVVSLPDPQLPAPEQLGQLPNNQADPEMLKIIVVRAIRTYYPRLLKAAQKGTDPRSYFDTIMDELEEQPAGVLEALIDILRKSDWATVLFAFEPLPHPKWFAQLRKEFIDWADAELAEAAAADLAEKDQPGPATAPIIVPAPEEPVKKAAGAKK